MLTVVLALSLQFGEKPLMKDFIGLNVHTVLFKPELYRPVASVLRDYHGVDWDLGDSPANAASFPMSKNGVNWNDLYGKWTQMGYKIDVTAQFEQFAPEKWTDIPKQAFDYGQAFASYYGPSGKHPYVTSFEIGNEPQKYNNDQYRAIFENMAKGLRKGDPKMLISTCAVAVGDSDQWSKNIDSLKGLDSLYDILNIHSYAMAEGWPTWRRSYPEDPKINFLKQIQSLIDWRNKNISYKPVWLTEFGWDSSTKKPPAEGDAGKWVGNTDKEQARYIVRAFLTLSAMDVERAYLYWFNDDDQPSLHAASGLTRKYEPKPSFHAMSHLSKTLGDYQFDKIVIQRTEDLYVYQFRKGKTNELIWAAWSPTAGERTTEVSLPKPNSGRITTGEEMPLSNVAPKSIPINSTKQGTVTIKVTGSPIYLKIR